MVEIERDEQGGSLLEKKEPDVSLLSTDLHTKSLAHNDDEDEDEDQEEEW